MFNPGTYRPKFGRPIEVKKFEFLDHVEEADPRTFVVVHLYEDVAFSSVFLVFK